MYRPTLTVGLFHVWANLISELKQTSPLNGQISWSHPYICIYIYTVADFGGGGGRRALPPPPVPGKKREREGGGGVREKEQFF